MKKQSEKVTEAKLRNAVKAQGGIALKIPAIHFAGLPDRLCLFPGGRVLFVETKSTGDKPSKIQKHVHKVLRDLGFRVEVSADWQTLKLIISEYAKT